MKIKHKLIL